MKLSLRALPKHLTKMASFSPLPLMLTYFAIFPKTMQILVRMAGSESLDWMRSNNGKSCLVTIESWSFGAKWSTERTLHSRSTGDESVNPLITLGNISFDTVSAERYSMNLGNALSRLILVPRSLFWNMDTTTGVTFRVFSSSSCMNSDEILSTQLRITGFEPNPCCKRWVRAGRILNLQIASGYDSMLLSKCCRNCLFSPSFLMVISSKKVLV